MSEPVQRPPVFEEEPTAVRAVSAIGYLGILFFLPLVLYPHSGFARFHANQALVLMLAGVALGVVSKIIGIVPLIGGVISGILNIVVGLALFVLMVIGIIHAAQGERKELPVLGAIHLIG